MKTFRFFIEKIFMKKMIIIVGVTLLIFISNYFIFITARSTISTLQGYEEFKDINAPNNFIGNLDSNSPFDLANIKTEDVENVYNFMNK